MNRADFALVIDGVWDSIHKLNRTKGRDYSGDEDVLENFKRNAERLGLTKEQVLGVYMNKHLDAIYTYISTGKVESEGIEGRIHDAVFYLILLLVMAEEGHTYEDKVDD